jgi:hypothetical protein
MSESVAHPDLASMALEESQPAIYDRPIGVRLLHLEPRTGAEHYMIRYPNGLQAQAHMHTAAHTIVVLGGCWTTTDSSSDPGSYCHFPAGEVMHHAPAAGQHCLFVLIFDGPFDVTPAASP